MPVVTRFAPSPTGYLHIGGARTALFNWLYAKHTGGKFLLRIEDTDRERSTKEAVEAIFQGLKWLGLTWDEEPTFQFERAPRHAEVAHQLVRDGKAYYCYASVEELEKMREEQKAKGLPQKYDGRWRDRDPKDAPKDVKPTVRIKAPLSGETVIQDRVQGEVRVSNEQLDDMILLRADGTPTYMLSVVVDDHDMGITDVIRGDDHLTNTFRQIMIYNAMGWETPTFSHIPLIHGPDGAKLSKRHGALGAHAYEEMGFLPEAMRNYLLKLGWAHGDDEIISTQQAALWFDVKNVVRSPARFDMVKLTSLNGHYIRIADNARLLSLILPKLGHMDDAGQKRLMMCMDALKERAKNLNELAESARFLVSPRPVVLKSEKAQKMVQDGKALLREFLPALENAPDWKHDALEVSARAFADQKGVKMGQVAAPMRAAVTGSDVSPPLFLIMEAFGKDETLSRLRDVL